MRFSSKSLLIVLRTALLVLGAGTSGLGAAPSDPFAGATQSFKAAPVSATNYNSGDWGVADLRGTATYTFPISVPPGRNGMVPALGLRYSSHSPLAGGVAAGWTLDLPNIQIDTSLGAGEGIFYKASIGGASGRLAEVDDKKPYYRSKAYRAPFDNGFTRIFQFTPGITPEGFAPDPRGWLALTSDGTHHYFEEVPGASDLFSRWNVTLQVDPFGNTVQYFWTDVKSPDGTNTIDHVIQRIEYTSNAGAGLRAHAKIEFLYAPLDVCQGSNVPIGAMLRKGSQSVDGSSKLTAIKSYVRDGIGGGWRSSREVVLNYSLTNSLLHESTSVFVSPNSADANQIDCDRNYLRYLTQIDITAFDRDGRVTALPPTKFSYNERISAAGLFPVGENPLREISIDAVGYAEDGNAAGARSSLHDIDADGVRDRLTVIEKGETCWLNWQKGLLGGGFAVQIQAASLPTYKWFYQTNPQNPGQPESQKLPTEYCTLSGQVVQREVPISPDENSTTPGFARENAVFGYHFLDFTADGRLDLLVTPPKSGSSPATLREDYPPNFPQPVGGSVTASEAPHRHTWWLYHNGAERPEYNRLHGVDSVLSIQAFEVASPVAMGARGGNEVTIDFQVPVSSLPPPLFDIDGDGFLDAIELGQTWTRPARFDCQGVRIPDSTIPRWCVYFGSGNQTFSKGVVWAVPWRGGDVGAFAKTEFDGVSRYHQKYWTEAGVYDVTGDGLADFVVTNRRSGKLEAYLNNGAGFSDVPVALEVISDSVERTQTDYWAVADQTFADSGNRGFRRRHADLDGDGLTDLLSFSDVGPGDAADITHQHRAWVAFNIGGTFADPVRLPDVWNHGKRLFTAENRNWQLTSDFTDVTGDGRPDLVRWEGPSVKFISRPGLTHAVDLLRTVDNGQGTRITFNYSPSSDNTVVRRSTSNASEAHLPSVVWVVSKVEIDGGFDTPTLQLRYQYWNPRYLSPGVYTGRAEQGQFAGFNESVTSTYRSDNSLAMRAHRIYEFKALRPDGTTVQGPNGHLASERTYYTENGTERLHQAVLYNWAHELLYQGQIQVTLPSSTITCTANQGHTSPDACFADAKAIHRVQSIWTGYAPSHMNVPVTVCEPDDCEVYANELFVRTEEIDGIGYSPQPGDLRTSYDFEIRYGQQIVIDCPPQLTCPDAPSPDPLDYRVRVRETNRAQQVLGEFMPSGRTTTIFDAASGLPTAVREWRSENPRDYAQTDYVYDPVNGNLLRVRKPMQRDANLWTSLQYDDFSLFVAVSTNELDQAVFTTYDLATGALMSQLGPNFKTFPAAVDTKVYEGDRWEVDGLGRITQHAIALDDESALYKFHTIEQFHFDDLASQNSGQPRTLVREVRGNVDASSWMRTETKLDGLGRALSLHEQLPSNAAAVTTYTYDDIGNLLAIAVPDPSKQDASTVTYTYHHDGIGRLTRFIRPDGANGLSIIYDGLEKTIREDAADASGSTRKEIYDPRGRLTEVQEFYPGTDASVTHFLYDANDLLKHITDGDGNVTEMLHDWGSNRISVMRQGRTWSSKYDLNGNLVTEVSPVPIGAEITEYTTTYKYDALDRVTSLQFPEVKENDAPPEDPNTLRPVSNIRYTYDGGINGFGRVDQVDLPFGQINYAYDARGFPVLETRSFALLGNVAISAVQRVSRTYDALGQLLLSTWDDGQQWRRAYDESRGLVASVEWLDPRDQSWREVASYVRNPAGLPIMRGSSFGQIRSYQYDVLGRPTEDATRVNGAEIALRGYSYTDAGDLRGITGYTADVSAVATYTYDAQHRLSSAAGPNGYAASFTYSLAGNIGTANVTWNGAPDTRNVRYKYGNTDPQAVDQLTSIAEGSAYATFSYDRAGNMIRRETPSGSTLLHWDGLGQLRRVDTPDGIEEYYYDHNGGRMLAVSESQGVRFWFGESETHYATDGRQTTRYLHLAGGGPTLARVANGISIELQYADALQNLMFSVDAAGNLLASFLYGAFGEVVHADGPVDHRRQFNGKEQDAISGLSYYGYRFYDPLILRWNSADPLYRSIPDLGMSDPQAINLYTFSMNNPVRYYDPDGRAPASDGEQASECDKNNDSDACTKHKTETKELSVDEQIAACNTQQCVETVIINETLKHCSDRCVVISKTKADGRTHVSWTPHGVTAVQATVKQHQRAIGTWGNKQWAASIKEDMKARQRDANSQHMWPGFTGTRAEYQRHVWQRRLEDGRVFDGTPAGVLAGGTFFILQEVLGKDYDTSIGAAKLAGAVGRISFSVARASVGSVGQTFSKTGQNIHTLHQQVVAPGPERQIGGAPAPAFFKNR